MNQNNDIKVSIRVLCYNQEKYIRQTLDSILTQDHPYSYEVIVCDDASHDSTPQIIEEYASRYKEIVPVLRKKNIGLIANFFDAVSRCRGEYMMGCAGDDYWLPGKIAKQVGYMDAHPEAGICYGDSIKIDEEGKKIGEINGQYNNSFEILLKSFNFAAGAVCQRSRLINQYIAEIDPLSKPWKMEDCPILLWFAYNSQIQYIPGFVFAYRVCNESVSHSRSIDKLMPYIESIYDTKMYFIEKYNLKKEKDILEYSYLMDLMSFLPIANANFKKQCRDQLNKCNIPRIKRFLYRYRIKYHIFNKIYIKGNNLRKRIENRFVYKQ